MSEIGQYMESLFAVRDELSTLTGQMVNEIEFQKASGIPDEEILEELNNFFKVDKNKFLSVDDAISYFEDLDI